MPTAVVLLAEVVEILPVARETRRTSLQFFEAKALRRVPTRHIGRCRETAGDWTTKIFHKLRTADTTEPLVGIRHDLIAARGEDVRGQPVVAAGHHTMTWFQMKVVAPMQRFLAMSRDIGTQMVLVGRLVIRKAGVAIETVGAVLHCQMSDGGVKGGNTQDGLLHTLLEVGTDGVILFLMLLKPRTVVIGRQLSQVF